MYHSKFDRRGVRKRGRSHRSAVREATARAAFEGLESRQLLTTHTFLIPTVTPPITSVYLRGLDTPGQVEVRRDSPTGEIIHTFLNTTGMDVIDAGSIANFLFVDQVPAAKKPTTDGTHDGIKVQGGSNGHLKIEAPADDERIRLRESTSSSATVEIEISGIADVANSRFGSGVNKLTIQTDPSGDASVRVATPENDPLPAPPNPQANDLPGLSPATALRIESLGPRDSIHLGGSENASVNGVVIRTGAGNNTVSLEQNHFTTAPHADGTTSATIDFDPTLGGGLGSDKQLLIGTLVNGWHCVATLARAGTGSHTIAVDQVTVANAIATATRTLTGW